MKNLIALSMVVLLFAGCSTTQRVFSGGGGSGKPQAAAPRQIPDTVKDPFNNGLAAYANEQYVKAQENFENVVRIDSSIPEAHLDLALSLFQQGKTDQANRQVEEARRIFSRSTGMGGSRSGGSPSSSNQGKSNQNP